jgi:protein SCO1/2
MSKSMRVISIGMWSLLGVAIVGLVALKWRQNRAAEWQQWTEQAQPPETYYPAASFSLTDQDDRPFAAKDLAGKPYVTSFVFTRCAGPCPMMTAAVARLQGQLPAGVNFVSVSVDPDYDRPPILKAYAKQFDADETRWHFLTGTREEVFSLARGMKLPAMPADKDQPILHSEKLVLIDGKGQVRGYYNGTKADEMARLVEHAKQLCQEAGIRP